MKKFVVVAGVVAMAAVGWRWHQPSAQKDGKQLVANRLWIDHVPTSEREMFDVFAVMTRENLCFFERRSLWLLGMEVCRAKLAGDELRALFPQTDAKETYTFSAKPCTTNGFDYCLEMSGGTHGAKKYYSKKDWVIRPGGAESIDALVKSIAP